MSAEADDSAALVWEIGIPLVTNPRMLKTTALVILLAVTIPLLLMTAILGGQGDWDALPTLAKGFGLIGLGLYVAFLLIMLLVFGNRMRTRYTLDEHGILQETIDQVARAGGRLAVGVGLLAGKPGLAGAGLLARQSANARLTWSGFVRLDARPKQQLLIFRNAWRPVLEVYCTPENYRQAETLARRYLARHQPSHGPISRSPLPRYLAHSALVLLASVALFALHDEYNLDLLPPILLLAFALATVWLVPLFGYVVLLASAWILLTFALVLLEERTSMFASVGTYRHYEVFMWDDWANLGLGLAALAYLSGLAYRAVRGRLLSLLMRDQEDMGG